MLRSRLCFVTALAVVALSGRQAAAQSAPLYVNAADIQVVPALFSKFMSALSADVAGTVKEAGCQELDVTVSQKDPHHVFIFEAYTNAAAWNTHQTASYFLKFYGLTAQMMTTLNLRPFSSVALNGNPPAQSGLFINTEDLDIVPAQFDAFSPRPRQTLRQRSRIRARTNSTSRFCRKARTICCSSKFSTMPRR
jgi:(4S)-4-hydroxy-5-phosphonooxypentane-2,3-dione isomerase